MTAPASLQDWVASSYQTPLVRVVINKSPIPQIVSVDVDTGLDQQSASATIRLPADQYPRWTPGAIVDVFMGYGGAKGGTRLVFRGEIEDIDTKYAPYFIELKAAGFLKRAQRNAGNTDPLSGDPNDTSNAVLTWANQTDSQIWNSLMALANIPTYKSGDGDSRTIVGPLYVLAGDNIRSKIDELDQASDTGQHTFEFAGTVYRRAALRIPMGIANYQYAEGNPALPKLRLFSLDRQSTDRSVQNQMIVQGQPAAGSESTDVVSAVVQAESQYWGHDGSGKTVYVPFNFSSAFIETRAVATAVANRYLYEKNKVTDQIEMRTPMNPFPIPGETVGITSGRIMGDTVSATYLITKLHHHVAADGATTDWSLEGGVGATGYLVGLPPIALFTVKVTKETWDVGGVATTFYTVTADGSTSSDPDGTIASYAWSNNANADTGTDVIYTTQFTKAQWDDTTTPASIQLIVTDHDTPDAHTDSTGMLSVSSMLTEGVAVIAMYVAAYGAAYATPDAWETVNSWTPPGGTHVLSTCRIAAEGTSFFGLDDGHIYKTTDYLASTPTAVTWVAPGGSAVNAIWMSETNTNVVAVGLADGTFWITKDAFATAPVKSAVSFTDPIKWINGSTTAGQWRVCAGNSEWLSHDDFQTGSAIDTFVGGTVIQTELTNFANYTSASGNPGDVLLNIELVGTSVTPTGLTPNPSAIRMTAFINTDTLLIGDGEGRSYISDPASAATAPVQKTDVGYGGVRDMLRDNTNMAAAYAACDLALAKTPDRAVTWHKVLTFNGTTVKGLQLGYDSAPLTPPAAPLLDALLERGLQPAYSAGSHDYPEGDDSTLNRWGCDLWSPDKVADIYGSRNVDPPAGWYLTTYDHADWVDPYLKTHTWKLGFAGIENVGGGGVLVSDRFPDFWVISDTTGTVPSGWPGSPGEGSAPKAAFIYRFVLPNTTINKVLCEQSSVGAISGVVYINGVDRSTDFISWAAYAKYIDPTWFIADGVTVNTIAIIGQVNYTGFAPLMGFKLTLGGDTGSVSLMTTASGKIYWGSTAEAWCTANALTDPGIGDGAWKALFVGALAPGQAYSGVKKDFQGIYEPPWPVWGKASGKKIANTVGPKIWGDPIDTTQYYHFTQSVDMPAGGDTAWKLYIRKFDGHGEITDVYLNGTRLTGPTPLSPAGDTANLFDAERLIYVYDIASGAVTMGGRNTLAIRTYPTFLYTDSAGWHTLTNRAYGVIAWVMKQQ